MNKEKIGIWGLGIVGKSVIKYLANLNYQLEVTDIKYPKDKELEFLNQHKVHFEADLNKFLNNNSKIVPSPGVDLKNYVNFKDKFLSELDIFYMGWQKNIIAITGTVGKTSITHILDNIFKFYGLNITTGGNIGIAMLDLLEKKNSTGALLEVSSFQLDIANEFKPDLAIITNIYPNHLDRHESFENYKNAKLSIIFRQESKQKSLIPLNLQNNFINLNREINYFIDRKPTQQELANLKPQDILYSIDNNFIIKNKNQKIINLINLEVLPDISYKANWLIIAAVCDILNLDLNKLKNLTNIELPNDRLELVKNINNILFYNDSKSTLGESTLAALEKLGQTNIHLFIGGISKGVDRTGFVSKLKNKVKSVYCFGAESKELDLMCKSNLINSYSFNNLVDAFNRCISEVKSGDIVLFSPAGASFDLYKNYHERGEAFKELVNNLKI